MPGDIEKRNQLYLEYMEREVRYLEKMFPA